MTEYIRYTSERTIEYVCFFLAGYLLMKGIVFPAGIIFIGLGICKVVYSITYPTL